MNDDVSLINSMRRSDAAVPTASEVLLTSTPKVSATTEQPPVATDADIARTDLAKARVTVVPVAAGASEAPAEVVIELRDLAKTFQLGDQTVHALDGIDLRILKGEYVSVMGPSGSGKSTLLNMLGLLDKPDRGSYLLTGIETTQIDEERRAKLRRDQIGFVFQSFHLIPRLSAQENIELPMMLEGLTPRERQRLAREVMERLSLGDRAQHKPGQLSGGQRQRVAIARAIVMRPSLLLADEPTGNLDSRSGTEVMNLLEELNRSGITLLMVTHDAGLGGRAQRRIRMVDGRVASDTSGNDATG